MRGFERAPGLHMKAFYRSYLVVRYITACRLMHPGSWILEGLISSGQKVPRIGPRECFTQFTISEPFRHQFTI